MVGVTGGDDMVAADINDILLYLPRWYVKGGSTSRNSGNHTPGTPSDDPDLAGIPLEVGSFEIEVIGMFTLTTTATQKIMTQWGFTGTWNGSGTVKVTSGPGADNTTDSSSATSYSGRAYAVSSQTSTYDNSASSAYAGFREIAPDIQVTSAGNFSFKWAQAVSSANNTNLQSPSAVRVTRKRT